MVSPSLSPSGALPSSSAQFASVSSSPTPSTASSSASTTPTATCPYYKIPHGSTYIPVQESFEIVCSSTGAVCKDDFQFQCSARVTAGDLASLPTKVNSNEACVQLHHSSKVCVGAMLDGLDSLCYIYTRVTAFEQNFDNSPFFRKLCLSTLR